MNIWLMSQTLLALEVPDRPITKLPKYKDLSHKYTPTSSLPLYPSLYLSQCQLLKPSLKAVPTGFDAYDAFLVVPATLSLICPP